MITAPLALLLSVGGMEDFSPAGLRCAGRPVPNGPCGNPYLGFGMADYPAAARRAREQGRVYWRVQIGPNGRVTACEITESSGSAALDAATCRIFRERIRYTPAHDAEGRPVASGDYGSVSWRLPSR